MEFKEWLQTEGLRVVRFPQAGGKGHVANFGAIQLRLMRDSETQEFVVAWYENGRYNEEKSYRTNDSTDALQTMNAMAQRILAQSNSVGA